MSDLIIERKPFSTIRGIAEEYSRLTPEGSKTIRAIADRALAEVEEAELQAARIAELESVLRLVKETYDNITTEAFRNGKDKPARDAVNAVLGVME